MESGKQDEIVTKLYKTGVSAFELKEYKEARRAFKMMTELSPYYSKRFSESIGDILFKMGYFCDAARMYLWAKTDNNSFHISRKLAEAYLEAGLYELASQEYEQIEYKDLHRLTEINERCRLQSELNEFFEANYQKNLLFLKERYPELANLLISSDDNGVIRIFRLKSGTFCFFDTTTRRLIYEDNASANENKDVVDKAIILIGLNTGYYLHTFLKLPILAPIPLSLGYKIPLYVVEDSLDVFRANLKIHDFQKISEELKRVVFFVGKEWKDDFRRFFSDLQRPIPNRYILKNISPLASEVEGLVKSIANERERKYHVFIQNRDEYYNNLKEEDLKRIFSNKGGRPLRILFLTSRFTTFLQYCTRDISSGFQELGHKTCISIEQDDISRITHDFLQKSLAEFKPDMIFNIDHLRTERQEDLFPKGIPFVTWIQDDMPNLFNKEYVKRLSDRDFIYLLFSSFAPKCYESGYKEIKMLPSACNPKIYNLDVETKKEYECDLAFVSHCSPPQPNPEYPGLIERITEIRMSSSERITYGDLDYWLDCIKRAERELSMDISEDKIPEILRYIDFCVNRYVNRIKPILWAEELGIKIKLYGKGWEEIPRLRRYAMGPVTPGEVLKSVYHSAKIHLHISEVEGAFHSRVLECIASGGFILMFRPLKLEEISNYLTIERDIILYDSKKDFQEKVRFYLNNETERKKISESGREKILKEHTYKRRAESIIQDIRDRLDTNY
ncbi:MAG: glycosyltransferase [bacterium]|nr:glycosyltransferase [bacterium]